MFSSNQPNADPVGADARSLLIRACKECRVGIPPVTAIYDACVARLTSSDLLPIERAACVARVGVILTNFIRSGNVKALGHISFETGLEEGGVVPRLEAAELVSGMLPMSFVSHREESLREQVVFSCLKDIFYSPLTPSPYAISELHKFTKNAPPFIDRVIDFERSSQEMPDHKYLTSSEIRFVYRADEIIVSNLRLLIENNMPADACILVSESFLRVTSQRVRDGIIDMWKWFAHSSMCSSVIEDNRLPGPLGRPALIGAIKVGHTPGGRLDFWGVQGGHQFPVWLPDSPHRWRYFAQRLSALMAIKDVETRDKRIEAYVVSFREFVAAHPFYRQEERFFREVNLRGEASYDARTFYSEVYGIDSPPAPEDSPLAERPLRETAQAFRLMAAARYGLNLRKGYTRTLRDSDKWLLEHMAEELKGGFSRYSYQNIDAYPGSGARIWGLDIRNALDLSSSESRRRWLKVSPWIGASLRVGSEVEYHLTRGFKAIARTLDAAGGALSREWDRNGSYDGEPYAALIFNDHFHNDLLPEVRMWLVPERVFHRKIVWCIENGVDINKVDLTPEGLAEDADALQLPIFDVGTSCCRWGSFSNAWPFATGRAFRWEGESEAAYSRWQSPRHVHRAMVEERYSQKLTVGVGRVMVAARVEHDKIHRMVNFFLDLHSSFLTMEEAWAKGYANADEDPAKEEAPPSNQGQWRGASYPAQQDPESFDLTPQRLRNRMLDHFLELRNQLLESVRSQGDRSSKAFDIRLELQYTRLFVRQAGTPYLSGADMVLVFPDGAKISMLGGHHQPGVVVKQKLERDERMEALWDRHIVSHFAPNNCPRIIYP